MYRYGSTHVNKMQKTLMERKEIYLRNGYFWGPLGIMG